MLSESKDNKNIIFFDLDDKILNTDLKAKLNSYFLNFYYDFYSQSNCIPYVNLGLGLSRIDFTANIEDIIEINRKETAFAWQIGAGTYYKISDNLLTDFGFKYSQASFNDLDIDANIFSISLGLRYNF